LDEDGGVSTKTKVPSSLVAKNLKEWGEGEPKRGKYSKISILNHFTTSGDVRKSNFSIFSSFSSGTKVEYSTEKYHSFDFIGVSTIGK
jgi:hypothetical protein